MSKDIYYGGKVDLPAIKKKRSFFDFTHSSHLDMNAGLLYPLDKPTEVIPGDSFSVAHSLQIRMTNPPKTPTMDQLVLDVFFFYCPNRILWTSWDEFITGDTGTDYTQLSSLKVPTLTFQWKSSEHYDLHFSVLDYLGVNHLKNNVASNLNDPAEISLLPICGYYKIYNEYFRYQSLQDPVYVPSATGSYDVYQDLLPVDSLSGNQNYDYYVDPFNDTKYNTVLNLPLAGLTLMRVNRLPDYFSRCLPEPQAGPEVKIFNDFSLTNPWFSVSSGEPLDGAAKFDGGKLKDTSLDAIVDISGGVDSIDNSIRSLSQAFALNKLLFIDNVYGRRITEWTYGHFGVTVPDDRVQRPEFITKRRIYININQIMQSSETSASSPQGNAGAWSVTLDNAKDFTKSFVEYGYTYALGCVRVLNHTYAQGIDRSWTKLTRFDYFMPEFCNIGDQLTMKREIYYAPSATSDYDAGFAFQERYAEYKFAVSRVSGWLRPDITNTLAIWTYTDLYTSSVSFNEDWMREPIGNIDRTLYISHTTAPQFIVDIVWHVDAYRPIPYHSIPGGLTGGF